MRIEKQNIPSSTRPRVNQRFRNFETDIDTAKRKLKELSSDKKALFGNRYTDEPDTDVQLEQRQQLLSGKAPLKKSALSLTDKVHRNRAIRSKLSALARISADCERNRGYWARHVGGLEYATRTDNEYSIEAFGERGLRRPKREDLEDDGP